MSARGQSSTAAQAHTRLGFAGLATLIGVAVLAAAAFAAPVPKVKTGALGTAPAAAGGGVSTAVPSNGVIYDDTGNASTVYYDGQGGHEALDDLHMTRGGTLDTLTFEYYDPISETFSATVTLYGNPVGLDLGATPLIGTYSVSGLTDGRHIVSVPLPNAPSVTSSIWAGVQFTSPSAGLIVKDVPSVGTSHDLYYEDGGFYNFGGSPKANFALRVVDVSFYSLNVATSGSGSVTKSPDQALYGGGSQVQLTAIPAPHYHFAGWSGDASGSTNPLTVTMDANKSITATFAIDSYTLSLTSGSGGGATASPSQASYDYGTQVSLTATPATGYHFTGWSGDASGTTNPLTVTMDANKTIGASFEINTYTLTVTTVGNGSVIKSPDQASYPYGAQVTLTAAPAIGWTFTGFSGDVDNPALPTAPAGSTNQITVIMDRNRSITATFTADLHTLDVSTVGSGTVAKAPNQATYTYGSAVQLTATPATGWTFAGWSGDASGATNPLTVTMDANKSITATFTINTYTLSVATVGSGTVAKSPDQATYNYGTSVQLTATPTAGWNFAGWSGDATGATNPLTVTMNANKNITATFTINSYTLAVTTVGSGTVAKSPNQASYTYGSAVQLTATPATGWTFAGWSGDATGATNPLTVTMDANKSITATFTINTYTLSVATVGSGTVAKSPNQATYNYGTSVQLTATPATGWSFAGWSGDASGATNPLTVTMNANKSITATFTINSYPLTVNVSGNGTVAKSPNQASYTYGAVVQLTATAATGSHFTGWSGDATGTTNPISITMNSSKSVTAAFATDVTVAGSATFESGLTGWEGYSSGTIARVSPGYNSSYAAKVTGPSSSTGEFGINDSPSLVPNTGALGTRYRVSARVRSDAAHGTSRVRIREYNNSTNQQTVYTPTVTLSPSWQLLTVEVVTKKASSWFDLQVLDQPVVKGEAFLVDNILVERLSAAATPIEPALVTLESLEPKVALEYARPTVSPNPARVDATLALSMAAPGSLRVALYDVAGRVVRVLADEANAAAGTHRFAVQRATGAKLGAGVYYYRALLAGTEHRGRFVILE